MSLVTEVSRAVFLSYASQDAAAARRLCEALQAAGIEVWFDRSELRGGDVWDQKIRRQIKECALFIPIISRSAQARTEGYFRLEWKLAVDRSHSMVAERAFLLPVVIDDIPDADALVPEKFREVHWTHLPQGETPPEFTGQILRLLSAADTVAVGSHADAVIESRVRWRPPRALWFVAAAAIAVGYFAFNRERAAVPAAPSGVSVPVSAPQQSIAVLPFADMSEKQDQEYFSDGLAEELLDQLAKIPGLHVIARTSSFSFKGKGEDIPTIARQLKVANILEGSVRKSGDRLRVTTQLIRADSGEELWSETYDRELKDVFQVQDEIAGAVVAALKIKLAPGQQTAQAHRTSNTEAYTQYLIGRQFFDRFTLDGFRRAIDAYRKAIELDPDYAAAYAELALALAAVATQSGDAAGMQQALTAADKAVALAPDQTDGYAARGSLRLSRWDWHGAQQDLEQALALAPQDSTVRLRYGALLACLGRLSEAIASTRQATELDPLSSAAWWSLGWQLAASQQFGAAEQAIRRALEIQPESYAALSDLGTLQLLQGKAADALSTYRKIALDAFRLTGIAMAEHTLSHAQQSHQALAELTAGFAAQGAYQIAQVYAWCGQQDQAFQWLDRAYRQRDGGLSLIKLDPLLASLHQDARFGAMLRKMQLPE